MTNEGILSIKIKKHQIVLQYDYVTPK